jgi:hypothetical protein
LPKKTFEAAKKAGAHLIVQVKENQAALLKKAADHCRATKPLSGHRTVDEDKRNRHETRITGVFDAGKALAGTAWDPYVKAMLFT